MKKGMIIFLSAALMMIGAPLLFAGGGKVNTDFFATEQLALQKAEMTSKEIVAGKNSSANSQARQHCVSGDRTSFSVPMYSVGKTYVNTGNTWKKAYFGTIDFSFECRYRVSESG